MWLLGRAFGHFAGPQQFHPMPVAIFQRGKRFCLGGIQIRPRTNTM
jgi:hypothetical protein